MGEEKVIKSIKSYNSVQFDLKKKPLAEYDECVVLASKLQDDVVSFVGYAIGDMMSAEIIFDVSKTYLDDPEAVNMIRQFIASIMEKCSELDELSQKPFEFDENFKKRFGKTGYVIRLFNHEYAELYIDSDEEDEEFEDFEDDESGLHFLAVYLFHFFDEEGFKLAKKNLDENVDLTDNTILYEVAKGYID